jgi:hypothetical protein
MNDVNMKQAALDYAAQGILVFPVAPKNDMPMGSWREIATTDVEKIEQIWCKHPKCNVGIKIGSESGVVVISFKTNEVFADAEKKGLPLTPTAKTGKGFDVYFKYQNDLNEQFDGERFPSVSLHDDGMRVLAPPSIVQIQPPSSYYKPDVYSWCEGKSITDIALADMPDWLLKRRIDQDVSLPDSLEVEADDVADVEVVQQDQSDVEPVMFSKGQNEDRNEEEVLVADKEEPETELSYDNKPEPVNDEWKTPKLIDRCYVEEIKSEVLPSWLGDFTKAISESKQTPEGLAVMLALSMIATCVQKKFVVAPHGDDEYTEPLALWTATVLKSGERKSPVLNALRAPLVSWQSEQAELLKDRIFETGTAISISCSARCNSKCCFIY